MWATSLLFVNGMLSSPTGRGVNLCCTRKYMLQSAAVGKVGVADGAQHVSLVVFVFVGVGANVRTLIAFLVCHPLSLGAGLAAAVLASMR